MRKVLYLGSLLSLLILLNTNISIAKDNHYNGHKNQFNKSGHVKYPHAKKHLKHDYNHKSDYKHYKYNNSSFYFLLPTGQTLSKYLKNRTIFFIYDERKKQNCHFSR